MEKLKKFFKSLIIRLVICENLVLASMLTQSLGTVSYLFLCAIPVVLFWRIGILKLCWKIIKGFFSIFAAGGSSNSSSNNVNTESANVKEPERERKPRKELTSAWQESPFIIRYEGMVEDTFHDYMKPFSGDIHGILVGYSSTAITYKETEDTYSPTVRKVDNL